MIHCICLCFSRQRHTCVNIVGDVTVLFAASMQVDSVCAPGTVTASIACPLQLLQYRHSCQCIHLLPTTCQPLIISLLDMQIKTRMEDRNGDPGELILFVCLLSFVCIV